jgi:hypothetical protein
LSVGTLTNRSALTLGASAVNVYEIQGTGAGNADFVYVAGNLTLTGRYDVALLNAFTPEAGNSFTNFQYTGTLTGDAYSFTNVFTEAGVPWVNAFSNGVLVGKFEVHAGSGFLWLDNYAVIPEPSALALVGVGLLLLMVTRRRRRA